MLTHIVTNTPRWVWILLLALLWLGLKQAVTRTASLRRITVLPLVMTGLSLYGTVGTFGTLPHNVLAWLIACGVAAAWVMQNPLDGATRYDPSQQRFTLPGSWVPLALIMGLFLTKYVVGASTTVQPALAQDALFSLSFCALYGAFSGVFLARAARLWRMALAHDAHRAPPSTQAA